MRRNKNGIALPSEQSPIQWKLIETDFEHEIVDACGQTVIEDVLTRDDAEFIVLAANYHERLADIVRRLDLWKKGDEYEFINAIGEDAQALWAEMTKEVQP